MARTIPQINIENDTFQLWVNRTNDLLLALSTEIITANDATANTGTDAERRRAQLLGRFGANTLVATDNLRGGNVGDNGSALLTISSNTTITGNSVIGVPQNFISYANVLFENANTQVNAQIITVTGNSFIKGNTSVVAINVLGNSTVTNTIVNGTDIFIRTTNTSINSISIATGNTFIKANSTITLLEMKGNGTTANTIMGGNLVQITANLDVTGARHTIAGNVIFDTTTMFVDSFNNRIGVGTITPDANLHVVGTANVSGATRLANTLNVVGAVSLSNTLSVVNAATLSNTIAITGAATLSNTLSVTGTATFGNSVFYLNYAVVDYANSNLGATVNSPLSIFTFNKTAYSSAKVTVQVKGTTGNTQTSEMVLASNGVSSYLTVYATVSSPPSADLGDFSTEIVSNDVHLYFKQNFQSSATKVIATLIK